MTCCIGLSVWLFGPPPFQVELVGWATSVSVATIAAAGAVAARTLALSWLLPADPCAPGRMRRLMAAVAVSASVETALLLVALEVGRYQAAEFLAAWLVATLMVNGLLVARGPFAPASLRRRLGAALVAWLLYPALLLVVVVTLWESVMAPFIRLFP